MQGAIPGLPDPTKAVGMKTLAAHSMAVLLVACTGYNEAAADIHAWLIQAQGTPGNVAADNTGWIFDGSAGVAFDYGTLDALEGKPVDGSTVEFMVNFSDIGGSISLGTVGGWSPGGEMNQYKLEQWQDTLKFGITVETHYDFSLATDSIFDQDIHVVFRRNNDSGTMDFFLNGVFIETHVDRSNWRMDGGMGMLGSRSDGITDVATGAMYGVASYDTALTDLEIADLYHAYDGGGAGVQLRLAAGSVPGNLDLSWSSTPGSLFRLLSTTNLVDNPVTWTQVVAHIVGTPPLNTESVAPSGEPVTFYLLEELPKPPLLEDDFEADLGWIVGSEGGPGTAWERGTPSVYPTEAHSPFNCYGTNLDADYEPNANVYLRSPAMDLSGASGVRLEFYQFVDIVPLVHKGSIRVLRAIDNEQLGADIASAIDGLSGAWEFYSAVFPAEAMGETVVLEFRFESNDATTLRGWYIDDVTVTVQ